MVTLPLVNEGVRMARTLFRKRIKDVPEFPELARSPSIVA
jgi:hypothetical protein